MEHIYIFDYISGSIFHTTLTSDETFEDVCAKYGLSLSDCICMITGEELKIEELE